MNYLQNNEFKYLFNPEQVYYNGSTIESLTVQPFISIPSTSMSIVNMTPSSTGNVTLDIKSTVQQLVYNFALSFTCSNFTSITTPSYDGVTSSDTITFDISADDITVTKTFPILPQYVNTFSAYGVIKVNKYVNTFTITNHSTIDLSYLPVKAIGYGEFRGFNTATCNLAIM